MGHVDLTNEELDHLKALSTSTAALSMIGKTSTQCKMTKVYFHFVSQKCLVSLVFLGQVIFCSKL